MQVIASVDVSISSPQFSAHDLAVIIRQILSPGIAKIIRGALRNR
jgi:hypothetical protein